MQVDIPVFGYGEVVRILDDIAKVHSLQAGHGEWNDDMALVCMRAGTVNTCTHLTFMMT